MTFVTAVVQAVLNSFWQAALLALVVWAAMRVFGPRLNAATRHVVWWIALAAITLLPWLPQWLPHRSSPMRMR